MLSIDEGRRLISIARRAIELAVTEGKEVELPTDIPPTLLVPSGVFITLLKWPTHELRGCIGFPYPEKPLIRATAEAAVSAALEDPRFQELSAGELDKVIIEVSVLTPPQRIIVTDPREYPKKIEVGRDGLLVKFGFISGLLLPQVPVEWGWDAEEYLDNVCIKAGLSPDVWMTEEKVEIYTFQAQIFAEDSPRGKVYERKLIR